MYRLTPAGYFYNDYKYSSQSSADWELVDGMRATSQPVSAYVAYGRHVLLVVGYETVYDPFLQGKPRTISGYYVIDPWYPHASDSPPMTYGDYIRNQYLSVAEPGPDAPPGTAPTIEAAVRKGMDVNGLSRGGNLGVDLTGYSLGDSAEVEPISVDVGVYELVELRVGRQVRAVAMVLKNGEGYQFAGAATGDYGVVAVSSRKALLARAGLSGPGRLVWGWTDEPSSPFAPFVKTSNALGGTEYLGVDGRHRAIHLLAPLNP